jgi:hypothetical protein
MCRMRLVFGALFLSLLLNAAVCVQSREFRWPDIVEGRETLRNYQNGDEIVLGAHANPAVRYLPFSGLPD